MRLMFDDGQEFWPITTLTPGQPTRVEVTTTPMLTLVEVGETMFAFPARWIAQTRPTHGGTWGTCGDTLCGPRSAPANPLRTRGQGGTEFFRNVRVAAARPGPTHTAISKIRVARKMAAPPIWGYNGPPQTGT
jgi:hypothetical protein